MKQFREALAQCERCGYTIYSDQARDQDEDGGWWHYACIPVFAEETESVNPSDDVPYNPD